MKILRRAEKYVVMIGFIMICLLIFFQVLNRMFFKLPLIWMEELARYANIYVVFIGAIIGFRKGSHVSITILTDRFKGKLRELLIIFQFIVVIIFLVLTIYYSWDLMAVQLSTNQTSPALKLNMSIITLAIPLFAIGALAEVLHDFFNRYKNRPQGGEIE